MQIKYATALSVEFFFRDPLSNDKTWQYLEKGPGIFSFHAEHDVSIRMRNINDGILKILVGEIIHFPQLFYLNLSENRKVTDKGCEYLTSLIQLRHLNLSSCDISNMGLMTISKMKALLNLNISFCNRITDAGILYLRSMEGLDYVDLQGLPKITNGSLSKIRRKGLQIHR